MKTNWKLAAISEIAEIGAGNSAPQGHLMFTDGTHPFVRTADVGQVGTGILYSTRDLLNENGISGLRRVAQNTILIPKSGASTFCNHRVIMGIDGYVSSHLATVAVRGDIADHRFVFYYLTTIRAQDLIQDHKYPSLNLPVIRAIPIPLPPLAEQKRIVAILDEAFASIDRAKEIAQKKVKATDHFQMSVYRAAFTGKLVDTVDQFDSIKMTKAASTTRGRPATDRIIMGEYALSVGKPNVCPPDGWQWLELTSIAKLESGHTPSRRHPEYWGGDVPWIGIKDARDHHGGTITKTREYTNVIGIQNSAARILPSGTVCLSRTASVGYVVVMGTEMATSQDFVNWVCSDQLDPHFLRYLFIAENQAYRKFSSGAVHQTIYFPEVKAFHVCIPSRSIQRQIVDTLDTILESTRRVVEIYGKQSALLNDLKQSILHKAFTGQLTAKSPELEAIP